MSLVTEISDTSYKDSQEYKGIIFTFPKATASYALKTTHNSLSYTHTHTHTHISLLLPWPSNYCVKKKVYLIRHISMHNNKNESKSM